jgi:hypothetical protein
MGKTGAGTQSGAGTIGAVNFSVKFVIIRL